MIYYLILLLVVAIAVGVYVALTDYRIGNKVLEASLFTAGTLAVLLAVSLILWLPLKLVCPFVW